MKKAGWLPWCRTILLTAGLLGGGAAPGPAWAAAPVANVRATQRAGTGVVDIYYDLTSASNALAVSVSISTNGGWRITRRRSV